MLARGGLVGVLLLAFWVWAVFDVIKTDQTLVRNLPKGMWLLLVLFLPDLGAVAWLLLGRPEGVGFSPGDTNPRQKDGWSAGRRDGTRDERRRSLAEQRAEYEELDRRLSAERAERQRLEAEERLGADQRKQDLAAWEADLLERERRLREGGH